MLDLPIIAGIGAGKLQLGTSKLTARDVLERAGYPLLHSHGELDYFCENSLQLEYEEGCVSFIGISDHPDINCTYQGIDVFDIPAVELFSLVGAGEPTTPTEMPGETCFFPKQGLNLWESDEQYDRKGNYKRKIYAQIGLQQPIDA